MPVFGGASASLWGVEGGGWSRVSSWNGGAMSVNERRDGQGRADSCGTSVVSARWRCPCPFPSFLLHCSYHPLSLPLHCFSTLLLLSCTSLFPLPSSTYSHHSSPLSLPPHPPPLLSLFTLLSSAFPSAFAIRPFSSVAALSCPWFPFAHFCLPSFSPSSASCLCPTLSCRASLCFLRPAHLFLHFACVHSLPPVGPFLVLGSLSAPLLPSSFLQPLIPLFPSPAVLPLSPSSTTRLRLRLFPYITTPLFSPRPQAQAAHRDGLPGVDLGRERAGRPSAGTRTQVSSSSLPRSRCSARSIRCSRRGRWGGNEKDGRWIKKEERRSTKAHTPKTDRRFVSCTLIRVRRRLSPTSLYSTCPPFRRFYMLCASSLLCVPSSLISTLYFARRYAYFLFPVSLYFFSRSI
ncbi:hypothetical protein C8R44DRAFT_196020 [Mycena epipterygia]|nr:hypothetical protein C8R44DRAFT_196020 [Mycena epipterygia]